VFAFGAQSYNNLEFYGVLNMTKIPGLTVRPKPKLTVGVGINPITAKPLIFAAVS